MSLPETIALLERFPSTLNVLLRGLPDAWTRTTEAPATWSTYDIVAHLSNLERQDWMVRVHHILQLGDTKPFDPIDRSGYKKEPLKPLPILLDEFALHRSANLTELRGLNLTNAQLELRGQHPNLGPVTLSQLLSAWCAHDMTHLHQLSRVLASKYRVEVGPWSQYLGVLHCQAHGAD